MAELSIETQAIIERLKQEGNLLRNSGSHSIRSVKADLSKFEGLFNIISDNVVEQTNILRQGLLDSQEQFEINNERSRRESAFAELDQSKQDELAQRRLDIEERRLANDLKAEENRANDLQGEKKGIFGMLKDGIGGLFKNKGLLIGGAAIAALLPVAYGFFDKITDGKVSEFADSLKDLDFGTIATAIAGAATGIGAIALAAKGLGGLAGTMSATMTTIAGLKLGTALTNFASNLRGGPMPQGQPGASPNPGPQRPGAPATGGRTGGFKMPGLGGALFAAAGVGILMNAQTISDYVQKQALGRTPNDVAGFDVTDSLVDTGTYMAGGASIGAMFGPKGALLGAAAGFAVGLGAAAIKFIDDQVLDNGVLTNEMEDVVNDKTEAEKELAEKLKERAELFNSLTAEEAKLISTTKMDEEIRVLKEQIANSKKEAEQTFLEEKTRLEEELKKEEESRKRRIEAITNTYRNNEEMRNKFLLKASRDSNEKIAEIQGQIDNNKKAALAMGADYDVINPNSMKNQSPLLPENQSGVEKAVNPLASALDKVVSGESGGTTVIPVTPIYNQTFNGGNSTNVSTAPTAIMSTGSGGSSDGLPM